MTRCRRSLSSQSLSNISMTERNAPGSIGRGVLDVASGQPLVPGGPMLS
jgi:hypothetical protein